MSFCPQTVDDLASHLDPDDMPQNMGAHLRSVCLFCLHSGRILHGAAAENAHMAQHR